MLGVIPARFNSKRILKKNIREFAGKPMIEHSIKEAHDSELFEHLVVSTDSELIAEISREAGAEVPFIRPDYLADDLTPTVPVIAHAINACEDLGWESSHICCIYPCSPFLKSSDLDKALILLKASGAKYSFGVTEFSSNIQRALKRNEDGTMTPIYPQFELTRTQDLEKSYHDAGQFVWGLRDAWINKENVHSNGVGIVIPRWRSVDIDSEEDWTNAELMFKSMQLKAKID